MWASILALISALSRYFGELPAGSVAAAPLPLVFFSVLLRLIYILVCSGVRLTESGDDLAAEEINELEGVLVLTRQAHEKLGTGSSGEPLLDFLACFRVPRDSGGWHGDDDSLVFHKGQWCVTICLRATAEAMESVWAGLTVCRLRPGASASRLRPS